LPAVSGCIASLLKAALLQHFHSNTWYQYHAVLHSPAYQLAPLQESGRAQN
jgi:hypothetical protein